MDQETPYRFVYVTAPNRDVALELGRDAVEKRLAACANVLPPMTSVYVWKDTLTEDTEVVLILKTRDERLDDLIEALKTRHPYECPCIIALPIVAGFSGYLDWIAQETM